MVQLHITIFCQIKQGPVHQTGGLSPGMHELLVIDANTCLLQKEFVINETTAPIILLDSVITGTCSGDLSSVYINTIGGLPPFPVQLVRWIH